MTFAFDLADEHFPKSMQQFVKFFNYSAVCQVFSGNPFYPQISKMGRNALMKAVNNGLQHKSAKQSLVESSLLSANVCRRIIEVTKSNTLRFDKFPNITVRSGLPDPYPLDYQSLTLPPCLQSDLNMWICKPAGFNRGLGIEIFSQLSELKKIVGNLARGYQESLVQCASYSRPSRSKVIIKAEKFVLQKYIEKPFLFANKKMDVRVWVLFTPDLTPYVFRECYFRLSSEDFGLDSANQKFVHLTNNALQKYSPNFKADATLKSIDDFDSFVRQKVKQDYRFREVTFPRIKSLVNIVFQMCKAKINLGNKKKAFEIFGFDFMMDAHFGVWLIEVNSNPSITTPCQMLKSYVSRMLDDALKLTLDPLFPSPLGSFQTEVFPMDGYSDRDNLWDPINENP